MKKNIQQRLRRFAALAAALVFALIFAACGGDGGSGGDSGSGGSAYVTYLSVDNSGNAYELTMGTDVAAHALYTAKANDKYVLKVTKPDGSISKSSGTVISVGVTVELKPNGADTTAQITITIDTATSSMGNITVNGTVTLVKGDGNTETLLPVALHSPFDGTWIWDTGIFLDPYGNDDRRIWRYTITGNTWVLDGRYDDKASWVFYDKGTLTQSGYTISMKNENYTLAADGKYFSLLYNDHGTVEEARYYKQ